MHFSLNSKLFQSLRQPRAIVSLSILAILYLGALFADFIAPYSPSEQNLKKTYHPPTALFWKNGKLHVAGYKNIDPTAAVYVRDNSISAPIHFFCKGFEYRFLGFIPCRTHLMCVDSQTIADSQNLSNLQSSPHLAPRLYLLGSDATGRDVFSRLLYGARVSMLIGIAGVSITMLLGLIIGGLSGYFGGWTDSIVMRVTELLMAIPGLYLLLALRGAFAEKFSSHQMFFLIVIILSLVGWPGIARVVRGMSLSIRQRPFVLAAEAMGQTPWNILIRHILPNILSYLIVAATMSIPGYILGEAALSFLGIGIQEPSSSWGLMLSQAQDMKVFMLNFWWLLTPGLAIFLAAISFNVLGDVLRDSVDPRFNLALVSKITNEKKPKNLIKNESKA